MSDAERMRRGALLATASSAVPPAQWLLSQLNALD
jgi:hypothetical protein